MEIPETFKDDLRIDFQDRLRIRWSGQQQSYLIQQKVGRNLIGSVPREMFGTEKRQDLVEGYRTIMVVSPSERVRCPDCTTWLQVPNKETAQIICQFCKFKGRKTLIVGGYYPLNSSLIHHLKSIDPMREADREAQAKVDAHNQRLEEQQYKQIAQNAEDYASDNINQLMGILQTGYTSKVKEGTDLKGFTK